MLKLDIILTTFHTLVLLRKVTFNSQHIYRNCNSKTVKSNAFKVVLITLKMRCL